MKLRLTLWMSIALAPWIYAQEAPPPDIAVAALYRACVGGNLDMVKTLVEAGAPINGQTGLAGLTPLCAATGHLDVLTYLIGKKAKLDIADYEGNTPLTWACRNDTTDTALALIAAGANVNAPNNAGRTPLMWAALRGNDQVVTALLAHKVNYNADSIEGPAIYWAVSTDKLSTSKLLVAAGARLDLAPDGTDPTSYSLMGWAALTNDLDLVNLLIDHKADINATGDKGNTPLMVATAYERMKVLERLLDSGAQVDLQNDEGNTALMLAISLNATQPLLQHHANLELKNKKGMTALMQAARWDNLARVSALVESGADINATDSNGETALTIAGDVGGTDVVHLLKEKGAKCTDPHIIAKDAPTEPLSPAQNWALALGAIFIQRDGFNPKVLGGGDNTAGIYERSLKVWHINDKAGLVLVLNDLRDRAHRITNPPSPDLVNSLPFNDLSSSYLAEVPRAKTSHSKDPMTSHPSTTLFPVKSSPPSIDYLSMDDRNRLASKLCRSVNLINAGFAVHYLTEQEAWDRLLEIARIAQGNFKSWQELNDQFLSDPQIPATERTHFEACSQLLLNPNDPNSPWNQNPWATDLSGPGDPK